MAARSEEKDWKEPKNDAQSMRSMGAESTVLLQSEQTKNRKTEDAVFSVLFALISTDAAPKQKSHQPHGISFDVVMEVFDVLQLASLACGSGAWHSAVAQWMTGIVSVYTQLLFGSWASYTTLYWLCSSAIIVSLGLSLFVSIQFRKGHVYVFPVRILRVLVPILVQGAYILALHLLLHPLWCVPESDHQDSEHHETQHSSLVEFKCSDHTFWFLYLSVSVALLILFIPYCAVMSELNHSHDPRGHELEARPHGHAEVMYLVVRTIMVFVARFFPTKQFLVTTLLFALTGLQSAYYVIVQPFYRSGVNQLRAAVMATVSFFALSSLILELMANVDDNLQVDTSLALMVCSLGACSLGVFGTRVRLRLLIKKHRKWSQTALSEAPSPHDFNETETSIKQPDTGQSASRLANQGPRRSSVLLSNGSAGEPEHCSDEDDDDEIKRPKFRGPQFWLETDVEVATRFIRKRRSPEMLEEADHIFRRGIEQFPNSAYVQICYAQFIMLYKHNTGSAMMEFKKAWMCETTIPTRFWLSSIRRNWERMNRSAVLGTDKMSAVQMLEFKQLYASAQNSHDESINLLRQFWHGLAKKNVGAAGALDGLPVQLEAINRSTKAASAAYLGLLKRFGNSKILLRSYGAFLSDCCNDEEGALVQLNRAEEIEDSEAKRRNSVTSVDSGSQGYSSTSGSSAASAKMAAGARKSRKRTRLQLAQREVNAVKQMRWGVIIGLIALVTVCVVSYTSVTTLFTSYQDSIQRIRAMTRSARASIEIAFDTRSLALTAGGRNHFGSSFEVESMALGYDVEFLEQYFESLFLANLRGIPTSSDKDVADGWLSRVVVLEDFTTMAPGMPPINSSYSTNLFEAGEEFISKSFIITEMPEKEFLVPTLNPVFLFIVRNAASPIREHSARILDLYEDETLHATSKSKITLGVLFGVLIFLLLGLTFGVFQPTFKKVAATQKGLTEIILNTPKRVFKDMARKYHKIRLIDADHGEQNENSDEEKALIGEDAEREDDSSSSSSGDARGAPTRRQRRVSIDKAGRTRKKMSTKQASTRAKDRSASQPLTLREETVKQLEEQDEDTDPKEGLPADIRGQAQIGELAHVEESASLKTLGDELKHAPGKAAGGDNSMQHIVSNVWTDSIVPSEEKGGATSGSDSFKDTSRLRSFLHSSREKEDRDSSAAKYAVKPKEQEKADIPKLLPKSQSRTSQKPKGHHKFSILKRRSSSNKVAPANPNEAMPSENGEKAINTPEGTPKSASSDHDPTNKSASDSVLKVLTRKYMLAFLLIAIAAAANLAVCYVFMDAGGRFASEIALAGELRVTVREMTLWIREGYINDNVLGEQDVIWKKAAELEDSLKMLQRSLMFGNSSMGLTGFVNRYPPQDNLWFSDGCLHIDGPAACKNQTRLEQSTYGHGLSSVMSYFIDQAVSSIAQGKCPQASCGPLTRDRLENSTALMELEKVADDYVDQSLKKSVDYLVEETLINVATVNMVETIILSFNIVFLGSLYVFLFHPMLIRLDSESGRTTQLLLMYPRSIVLDIPYLCSYFVKIRE
mmetsp:Transcript_41164/g.66750  ORF Transcript_41164/g.66750 Transcript_41164/m.66750 type:complete len:1546 (-) Transcript_41164:720-5357(-)|eukprot:CAMPEP_0184361766 /NCGR_PEP_ID=MMETSP1089-20130417/131881_1 /TAXON_ID=38269 ORGANISM="Gloeochaete wittrockiana, Strain SAG46.84" /NCGR_SAMPLE_ID=MMETSP1089 /ASSEMBLY_ACC=CAM_ASM_000445 /LENGTH=1545 /DNA_ID=CAMNT_0026701573 /DNA_START=154 /DNA_END=4791 /DNA_ORIENTATION=-